MKPGVRQVSEGSQVLKTSGQVCREGRGAGGGSRGQVEVLCFPGREATLTNRRKVRNKALGGGFVGGGVLGWKGYALGYTRLTGKAR